MKPLRIGVVEENEAISRTVLATLKELGYISCTPAVTYEDAIEILDHEKPDLLLLGIPLTGEKNGLDLAQQVNDLYKIPFVFLAAQSSLETINRAKKVNPYAYISIPFNKQELFAAIEIAFSNFSHIQNEPKDKEMSLWHARDFMYVKDGYAFHKVFFKDIVFLESDGNYITIHLQSQKKVLIRCTLKDFTGQSNQTMLMRVHRSYSVNINKIDDVFPANLTVQGHKIPVGKSYKEELFKVLGISKN